jgi:hypothetical protein
VSEQQGFTFDGFAIFEAMGHIKRVGKVRTSDLGGSAVFVVETRDPEGQTVTEIFAASALFRLTPVTEGVVHQIAGSVNPAPIDAWDLPVSVRNALQRIRQEARDRSAALPVGDEIVDDTVPF